MPSLLIVTTEFPPGPGGIGSHGFSLARQLVEHGWQVAVAAPQDYADDDEVKAFGKRLRGTGIELTRLRHWPGAPIQGTVWAFRLAGLIRRRRPQLLLASGQRAVWLTAFLARCFQLPWAAVGHGTELAGKSGWQLRLNRRSFSSADLCIWVSRFTRDVALGSGIRPQKSEVVPNGADSDRFQRLEPSRIADFRRDRPIAEPSRRLLLTVGHVDRRKGQDVVVRALPSILRSHPDVHYAMIGLPTRAAELEALARELGVSDRVHALGRLPHDDLVGFLNACDLFVMASRHTETGDFEGFGIAVVEAALCGKPAVVSESSGLVEAIDTGQTGLAVPPDDPDALAEAITALLSDPDRLQAFGEAAHERARNEQTWERRGRQYDQLLSSLVGPRTDEDLRP